MSNKTTWEEYYKNTPLDKIQWENTQADYFIEVIDKGKVKAGIALDLGCGAGNKSIYLAKKGFEVTGIDISKTAIRYAKEEAKKNKVNVKFIVADATDLSFLGDKKFDFVLDWANLHGIPKNKRMRYITEIVKHTKIGSKFLLRCFSKRGVKRSIVHGKMGTIYLFSKKDINKLYKDNFKIIETHRSKPFTARGRQAPAKWLDEYLMEKK